MSSRLKKCVAAFSILAIVLTLVPDLSIVAADVASTEEGSGNTPLSGVTTNIGKIEYSPEMDNINAYVPAGSTATVFTKDRDFNVEESEGEKVININCTESSYAESNIYIPFSENGTAINRGSKVKVSFDYYVDSGSAHGDGNGFRVWLGRANDGGCMVSSDTIAWFEDNAKGNNRFVLNRGNEYKNVEFEMNTTGDNVNAIVFKWIYNKPVRNLHIKNIRVWRDIDVPGSELTTLKDSLILYHNQDRVTVGEDGSVSLDRESAGYGFKGFRIPLDRIICNEGDAIKVTIFGESSGGGKPRLWICGNGDDYSRCSNIAGGVVMAGGTGEDVSEFPVTYEVKMDTYNADIKNGNIPEKQFLQIKTENGGMDFDLLKISRIYVQYPDDAVTPVELADARAEFESKLGELTGLLGNSDRYTTVSTEELKRAVAAAEALRTEVSGMIRVTDIKGYISDMQDAIDGLCDASTVVSTVCTPSDAGRLTGAGRYKKGDRIEMSAEPNSGYAFVGWYADGELYDTSSRLSFDAGSNGIYLPDNTGQFVINPQDVFEQSEYAAYTDGSDGIHKWEKSGNGMQVTPLNAGSPYKNSWTNTDVSVLADEAPSLIFQVDIPAEGDYYLLANMSNPDNAADSFHVVADGVYKYTQAQGEQIGFETWYGGRNTIHLAKGGHTLTIYAREDGLLINQLLLTTDKTLSGNIPAGKFLHASARKTSAKDFTAKFKSTTENTLTVTNDSGSGTVACTRDGAPVTLSENDGGALTAAIDKGSQLTLTAQANEGYTFLYWIDASSGRILSEAEDGAYTFLLGSDIHLKACYKAVPDGGQTTYTVTFRDMNGKMLDTQSVASGQDALEPAHGTFNGYTFKCWDKEFDNISGDLVVTAQYDRNSGYTLAVTNGTILSGSKDAYDYADAVTVCADAAEGGAYFSGWYSDGMLVSSLETFTFRITGSMTMEASYGETGVADAAILNLSVGARGAADPSNANRVPVPVTSRWHVPDGSTVIETGVLYTLTSSDMQLSDEQLKELLDINKLETGKLRKSKSKLTSTDGVYSLSINLGAAVLGHDVHVRSYMVYRDSDANVVTEYSGVKTSKSS